MGPFSRPFWAVIAVCLATAVVADIPVPGCQSVAPAQEILNIKTGNLSVSGPPFGLAFVSNEIALAAIQTWNIGVLNTSTFPPTIIRELTLSTLEQYHGGVAGVAISSDKKTFFVTLGPGAVVIDVDRAVAGASDFIIGFLNGTAGNTAIEVTLSADDEYAFVSIEDGDAATSLHGVVQVFQLHRDINNGNVTGTNKGYIELGFEVVGTALSTDGSKLYATSEQVNATADQGTLSVLDVALLKTNPSQALISSVDAGCNPVRVAVSANGKYVWVTARASNMLLAFEAAKLVPNCTASDALAASVQVGTLPVGLTFVNHGRHIITADSNRFTNPNMPTNATTGLTVVDVEEVLRGKKYGGFPRILTGAFPRELAVSPDGKTMLVAQYDSDAIQAVDASQLR